MSENPLQNCTFAKTESQNKHSVNARGRPKTEKTILFSEQPQSIVSQILSKVKSDNQNIGENLYIEEILQGTFVECENNELFKVLVS